MRPLLSQGQEIGEGGGSREPPLFVRRMLETADRCRRRAVILNVEPDRSRPLVIRIHGLPPESSPRFRPHLPLESLRSPVTVLPGLYRTLRDQTARRKGHASRSDEEAVTVSAGAISATEDPQRWRTVRLRSDYSTTGAVAVGTALAAVNGDLPVGAGLLRNMTDLESVSRWATLKSRSSQTAMHVENQQPEAAGEILFRHLPSCFYRRVYTA